MAGTGLFVFVIVTVSVFREFLQQLAAGRITPQLAGELILLLIPYALAFALPMGLLIGILVVLGRLSAGLEITAMKAAGLSLWRICAPIIMLAILAVSFSGYITAYYAPSARENYKEILRDLVRNEPLRFIVARAFVTDFPGYTIYVGETADDTLRNLWIWELDDDQQAIRLLRAEEGQFAYDDTADDLILTIRNGFTELRDANDPENLQAAGVTLAFDEVRLRLSLEAILGEQVVRDEAHEIDPRNTDLDTLMGFIAQLRAAEASGQVMPGFEDMAELTEKRFRMEYQIQRNLASAFGVLSLVLLAIPLGIQASRSETVANFAIALALALTYYVLQIIIDWQVAKPHLRPDLLVWAPNLLFQGAGLWLIRRADRY